MTETRFRGWESDSPAITYAACTPSDSSANDHKLSRAFFVGGDGNVAAVSYDNTAVTFTGCLAGQIYPISTVRINATNTTATNIVLLF